ncbi:MAG: hypothetical protein JOY54_11900 [Acidobacteriaceae bacterium]|nr:hypothetical protein [Acidobacteriaceae bacterium]
MPVSFAAPLPPEFPFPEPNPAVREEHASPLIPVVYEVTELENMTLRIYAAIHLRVPDSGVDWLDKMIRRSRKLDLEFPRE